MRKKYNTPHRSRVVKTRLSEDEYADFTARLAPYQDNIFLSLIKMQHFGKIKNCYMRICDQKGKELCRYTLSENGEYNRKSAMIFGELLKQDDVWVFHAIGQGTNDHSIDRLAASFK